MTSSGEEQFLLIMEDDNIFLDNQDYSGNYQTPNFMSDHTDSCHPNAVICKVMSVASVLR